MSIKSLILRYAPILAQNVAISIYNYRLYRQRHGQHYHKMRDYFAHYEFECATVIDREVEGRLDRFLQYASNNSPWFKGSRNKTLKQFPVLEKEDLIKNFEDIRTVEEENAIVSLTGGTTGASMKVLYTHEDIQERFALLDHFRSSYGYQLGKKTAWFSGKSLVREKDLASGNLFRDDYINKIRFFSTFHISHQNFDSYWKSFCAFSPEFIVGFPSSVFELCRMAFEKNLEFTGSVKVFFPTAETVLAQHREVITKVLDCKIVDQYASSEGAPFILQCHHGSLHINMLSGVFEVVDKNMQPASEGEILVTSFTTHGTPLIRYRVGDRIKLAPEDYRCPCGSCFPVVEHIDGRTSDFLWSPENGRVNLGNLSNCTKDVEGIVCFQAIQKTVNEVSIFVVSNQQFCERQQSLFLTLLRERLGSKVEIRLSFVKEIPREKSGKYRIVKNFLSSEDMHLLG